MSNLETHADTPDCTDGGCCPCGEACACVECQCCACQVCGCAAG